METLITTVHSFENKTRFPVSPKQNKMKTNIQFVITTLVFFLFAVIGNGQEALVSSGGNAESTGGTVSFTLGQTVFNYFEDISGTVSQGMQQPYEIFLLTGIDRAQGISLDCTVYPNPAQHQLQLKIGGLESEKLRWGIYNLSGKLIKAKRVSASLSTIPIDF